MECPRSRTYVLHPIQDIPPPHEESEGSYVGHQVSMGTRLLEYTAGRKASWGGLSLLS